MELQAKVQAQMPFGNKMRKPGDIIPSDEWLAASQSARDALVNQKYVVLIGGGEGSTHDGAMPLDGSPVAELSGRVDAVEGKLDEVLALLRGPTPKKSTRKRRAKKA